MTPIPHHRVGPVGRRQFLISADEPPPGFVTHPLKVATLHTCPSLPVHRVDGPGGRERVLLGVATHTRGGDVLSDMATVPDGALHEAYHHWTGRWVLIDGDELHMDATGMLSVFYSGRTITSTPALLGVQPSSPPPRREHAMPYLPGPATAVPGVERLLPSQRLSLVDGQIRSRPLIQPVPAPAAQAPALVDQLGEIMLESVRTAAELGPVVLPLTGGYDSRLILAACVKLGMAPRLITQAYVGMARSDIDLPQEMGRRLGLPHEVIRRGPRNRKMGKLYDDQVSQLLGEQDRTFLEYQQFGWLHEGDVLLRGIMLDDARGGVRHRLEGVGLDADELGRVFHADPTQRAALGRWVDWVKQDPQPISLHDRLCLEQRDASYAATAELALDLMAPHSMLPGNSGSYQETAFSLPLEWQFASRHHTVLVDRWAPALADLPYNPPLTSRERLLRAGGTVRRRARRVLARMGR